VAPLEHAQRARVLASGVGRSHRAPPARASTSEAEDLAGAAFCQGGESRPRARCARPGTTSAACFV
jgi:hypothetical protein